MSVKTGLFFEAPLRPQGRRLFRALERYKGRPGMWHLVEKAHANNTLHPMVMEDPDGMIPYGHISPGWAYHGIRWAGGNLCELTPNGVWRVRCALVVRGAEILTFADWVLSWAITRDIVLYTRHEDEEEDHRLCVQASHGDICEERHHAGYTEPEAAQDVLPPSRWDV